MEGKWLSILEYAAYRNKSISTIRRYIKNDRVKYRDDNGKYYVWAPNFYKKEAHEDRSLVNLKFEVKELKDQVRKLKEENEELRMLVDIYERKMDKNLPELPNIPEIS